MNPSEVKSTRLLTIYSELVNGAVLQKSELAHRFHITQRSVQRDIELLRFFFAEQMLAQDIVYDNREKGYRLTNTIPKSLSNSEILAVCKILLESRSMVKEELSPILDKLVDCCVPAESKKQCRSCLQTRNFCMWNLITDGASSPACGSWDRQSKNEKFLRLLTKSYGESRRLPGSLSQWD